MDDEYYDVSCRVRTEDGFLDVDHGYALYSALKKVWGALARDSESGMIALHRIVGKCVGDRLQRVDRNSRITLRVPKSHLSEVFDLRHVFLSVKGRKLQIGKSFLVQPLNPCSTLQSWMVALSGSDIRNNRAAFQQTMIKKLQDIGLTSGLPLFVEPKSNRRLESNEETNDPIIQRSIRIGKVYIHGAAVCVVDLTERDSIRLQSVGLGGRRHFGCGVFMPFGRHS